MCSMEKNRKPEAGSRRMPAIDLWLCSRCGGCIEIAPEVFRLNSETGAIEVIDLPDYPVDKVDEAIMYCPEDCISWES